MESQENGPEKHHGPEGNAVTIRVNEHPVKFHTKNTTGAAIKHAAIEQGVPIKENDALYEELPEGKYRVITDHHEVHLHEDLHFLAEPASREVTVTVNEQPVKLHGKIATGTQIKTAAIAQGVHIQQNFILQEELPNGTSRVIGDDDEVYLREHLRFTAIAPDDNS